MRDPSEIWNLAQFASFAGDDLDTWTVLTGQHITHCTAGQGEVLRVFRANGHLHMDVSFPPSTTKTFWITPTFCRDLITRVDLSADALDMLRSVQTRRRRKEWEQRFREYREQREREAHQQALEAQRKQEIYRQEVMSRLQAWAGDTILQPDQVPYGPLIYHITHVDNLAGILAEGCVWCDSQQAPRRLCRVSIGHRGIKDDRLVKHVPLRPGGVIADYVPFYFGPRSPMLYTIYKSGVEGYSQGQAPVIYLVRSVKAVCLSTTDWVFSDGNARANRTNFYDDLGQLNRIDWSVIRAEWWGDSEDSKHRRQAEFLVYGSLPWTLIHEIGVINWAMARQVADLVANEQHRPRVTVHRGWYF